MPSLTEGKFPGEFLVSEANGRESRDVATLITGQKLNAGAVCATITASGKKTFVVPGNADGSQIATCILYANTDATSADKAAVFITRNAEVNQAELDFGTLNAGQITTAIAQLAAVGIIVRAAV